MTKLVDMTGSVVHGIQVLCRDGHKGGKPSWLCLCSCGERFAASDTALRLGRTKGCPACVSAKHTQRVTKHGGVGSREYTAYHAMKARCYDPANKRYSRYGGRGIVVCSRWLESFSAFLSDMGVQPTKTHTLERLNLNGNYEPANCVWATLEDQANNRSNNTRIEICGRTQTLTQWSKESGVNRTVILRRMKRGISGAALIAKTHQALIAFNEISDSIAGWSKRTGIKASTIAQRLTGYGWSVEDALTKGVRT